MIETIFIRDEEVGTRLDKLLAIRFQSLQSRTYFQKLIQDGHVLVNGNVVKKRIQPLAGDEVEIHFILTPEIKVVAENIPLNIIYEDEHILVVNKEAGMVVHPAAGHWSNTFVNALIYHCQLEPSTSAFPRPGIVHRLDKDTSGVLVAAKHAKAQARLIEMFANREVYKEYLAICLGNPKETTIDAPIGRHPVKRKEMAVVEEGRGAITHCFPLSVDSKLSLVRVVIETGRTHQIRVHLRHRGTPVLGDSVYGKKQVNEHFGAQRQMLHAHRLRFSHPITGEMKEFEAKIPEDMLTFSHAISHPKSATSKCFS